MDSSIVVLEKPTPRVALPDWFGKVWELRQSNDTRRHDAFLLRNEARQLRNETETKASWNTYHNNNRLVDRLVEVSRWRDALESSRRLIDNEISDLKKEKNLTEAEIEFLGLNFTVINECLSQRDQRGGADLCTDEAEIEIKLELKILEALKVMLAKKCMTAWEQSNRLEEVKALISNDIDNKDQAILVDTHNLGLDKNSSEISFKPNPEEITKRMISYQSWSEHTQYIKLRTDNELTTSKRLRETMSIPRERARNDMKAQNEITNFAIRKRIYQTQRIKNELEWQRLNMENDLNKLLKEVELLESAFLSKTNSLKLAETRLQARGERVGAENCMDEATLGLIDETNALRETRETLKRKMEVAKITYNALEDQLGVIIKELANKTHALSTDIKCLDLRGKLVQGPRAPPDTETDRNLSLTKMKDELPPN